MNGISEIIQQFSEETGLLPDYILIGAFLLLLLLLFIIVAFMGYFRILSHIAAFAYPVSRVKAIGNPFVKPEYLNDLVESKSLHEIAEKIKEHGYNLKLAEGASLWDLDLALYRYYLSEYVLLESSVPDSIRPFFAGFRSLLEIDQFKTALRSREAGLAPDLIVSRMTPIGLVTQDMIEGLAHASKMEEIVSLIQDTPYGKALQEALPEYREQGSTLPLERALDLTALRELNRSRLKVDNILASPVQEFCGVFTDITNILVIFRARAEGIDPIEASRYIAPGGAVFEEWRLRQLLETPTISEILHQLSGTDYFGAVQTVIPRFEKSKSVYLLECQLERFLLDECTTLALTYHLTGGPLIKFIVARNYEIRNIRTMMHSLMEGIPLEGLSGHLIEERGTL
jgi:V/A-type H+-transporting ATPase subunit C